jgi:hypothetical protein
MVYGVLQCSGCEVLVCDDSVSMWGNRPALPVIFWRVPGAGAGWAGTVTRCGVRCSPRAGFRWRCGLGGRGAARAG